VAVLERTTQPSSPKTGKGKKKYPWYWPRHLIPPEDK
jgi:hypothetical protein